MFCFSCNERFGKWVESWPGLDGEKLLSIFIILRGPISWFLWLVGCNLSGSAWVYRSTRPSSQFEILKGRLEPNFNRPGPNQALLGDESATTSTKIKSPLFTAHNLGVKTDTLVLELEDEWFDNSRGMVKLKDEWFGLTKDNWFRLVSNPPWDGFLRYHFFTNERFVF